MERKNSSGAQPPYRVERRRPWRITREAAPARSVAIVAERVEAAAQRGEAVNPTGATQLGGPTPRGPHGGALMARRIDHVVVLMLENRGFDHALGWLYEDEDPELNLPATEIPPNQAHLRAFEGLQELDLSKLTNTLVIPDPDGEEATRYSFDVQRGCQSPHVPSHNPHEDYEHILAQCFGVAYDEIESLDPANINMKGFAADFATEFKYVWPEDLPAVGEVMQTYLPDQLPVLNGLARHYAVSDLWFCSVPTQTNANRAFTLAGTSRGMVKNDFYPLARGLNIAADQLPADTRTIYDVLDEAGMSSNRDWMYFWHTNWPPIPAGQWQYARILFPSLANSRWDPNFAKMDEFFRRAKEGTLAKFSFIEPKWGGGHAWDSSRKIEGNDYHPVCDTTRGEDLVKSVYEALAKGRHWENTLLLVTFDENGGTYDHMPPWAAEPTGRDRAPAGHKARDLDPNTGTEFGFGFDLYGVRVPAIAISPWIAPGTVFRSPSGVPYDHTSIISTILEWLQIPDDRWKLGKRVQQAPSFEQVLSLDEPREAGDPHAGIGFGSLPKRAHDAKPLTYGQSVRLKYIGNPWDEENGDVDLYLGPAEQWPRVGGQYYPTLVEAPDAVLFSLMSNEKNVGVNVTNYDTVLIKTLEQKVGAYSLLGAWKTKDLYYYSAGYANQMWQLRLRSCPDSGITVYEGDQVVFLSHSYGYQRMIPDPDQPRFLTTKGGEWAVWQIVPVVG